MQPAGRCQRLRPGFLAARDGEGDGLGSGSGLGLGEGKGLGLGDGSGLGLRVVWGTPGTEDQLGLGADDVHVKFHTFRIKMKNGRADMKRANAPD
jgi:hypothetical protein